MLFSSSSSSSSPAAGTAAPVLDVRFLCSHPAHWMALGFGSGLSPVAPGTVGTLWAWLSFTVLDLWLTDRHWALLLVAGTVVGWWACTVTAAHLRREDPGNIVWDEVIAFWLVLWLLTPPAGSDAGGGGWTQLAAFLCFRFFDAAKPGPVRWADRRFKGGGWRGGFGILFDDLVAAFCTLLVFALWRALVH
ncbi:phosphatidylglycerophosphatase A [Aquabacterium sp. A7-Y]|uniref:phosphatidylglycerophosphatase A family protein n=1 Tax=Aquabacterium sp. A7-Y TaxID=1349605 RepID=UPI00223DC507|nr:phosphatidylglycerophosphatase A [Aquabacterium sp. A7-Y]MCW7536615.1 phosphatidylglycerophosphatase A [Aquabacterium sp. A7-Y]